MIKTRVVTKERYINPDQLMIDINKVELADRAARLESEQQAWRPVESTSEWQTDVSRRINAASERETSDTRHQEAVAQYQDDLKRQRQLDREVERQRSSKLTTEQIMEYLRNGGVEE